MCHFGSSRARHILLISGALIAAPAWSEAMPRPDSLEAALQNDDIIVTASTIDLLGKADTSSQGSITRQELQQRPVYRVGQLLETVPGLTVTSHSGEGKANQYLLRGFNLDHGTDLASFVDGMPVNQRSHAHGQGYTDINFMIPELGAGVDFSKGPYFASEGDFGSVGADHLRLVDTLIPTITIGAGTVGDRRAFAGGSIDLSGGSHLLAVGEYLHIDGPWDSPDNFRKFNGALRWSNGTLADGFSLTAMGYDGRWNATTDQPTRVVDAGLIGRYGSLDTSDGGKSSRYSLSASMTHPIGDWTIRANAYVIRQRLTLWNNFTHYLDDPVNGDQHAQHDQRTFAGGMLSVVRDVEIAGITNHIIIGAQGRYDDIRVDLLHTIKRAPLDIVRDDHVREASVGGYVEDTVRWTPRLRTVIGLREDYYHVSDRNFVGGVTGSEHAALFQPKGSLILGPWAQTEIYVSAGRGFHSNDGRAGLIENSDGSSSYVRPPLLVRSTGEEIGIRTSIVPHLTAAVTVFQIDFASELTYNADAGQTEAGRPSRRRGVEITGQYRPFRWLELNANLAISRARYRSILEGGNSIEDAPGFVGSAGLLIDNLGPWFSSVAYRNLGAHPLTQDNRVRSSGYREVNANLGYKITPHLKIQVDVYNVTNSRDDAADYYYTTRLAGEPADGVDDIQAHPLELRSARFTVTANF
ncbi:MAG: TonB-dependent receptor [Sphingomonadales bacterium]|nr:TonB-dependent receptor [Sphingomonadales bacterium]